MLSALNDGGERSKTLLSRLADQPKSPAIIGVAETLCEQGHCHEAITRLRSVAEFYADTYRFNLALARALRDAGDWELAKQHYEKACQIAPHNEVAIKELIALTAFPRAVPKPSPRPMGRESAMLVSPPEPKKPEPKTPEPQASHSETPSAFKLDREKLSKALGGVIGSAETSGAPSIDSQKSPSNEPAPVSPVMEAFRKADDLLEQEPDIDALAREMMGHALPQTPPASLNDSPPQIEKPIEEKPIEEKPTEEKPIAPLASAQALLSPQSSESEVDIDAIARQMLGIGYSDEPTEPTPSARAEDAPAPQTSATQTSQPSASAPIPLDENGNPIIKIDRNKLTQALSGIYKAKGIMPTASPSDEVEDDETPFPTSTKASVSRPPEPPPLSTPVESASQSGRALSFEEELMALQMQGGDIDAFIANKDAAHHNEEAASKSTSASLPLSEEYDIDALAREMMNAQMPKVVETNDPTPVSEQRQPFSDDDEIKTPTRQLAKIFQAQGAYAKAIKVYEMLAAREPENASLYDILISELRDKMNAQ